MNAQRISQLVLITAAATLAAGTPALAARKRSRIIKVRGSQRTPLNSSQSITMPLELRVRLRKSVAFGIRTTRAIGEMRRGFVSLRFSSRRWNGHSLQTETYRQKGNSVVSTVSAGRQPYRYTEGFTRTPGKRTITHRHTLRPHAVYPFHTAAALAVEQAANGTRLAIRRIGSRVQIAGSAGRVDVPSGATVYDAMKAVAYMDGIDRGLIRVERSVRVDEFRGEWTLQRANVAMVSPARAFESALSTFIYQGYLLSFVERFRTMNRATLVHMLDTHMDMLRHQSVNPGKPYTTAMAKRQLSLGNRSAGDILTLLNDLADTTQDQGLDPRYRDVVSGTRAGVLHALEKVRWGYRQASEMTWYVLLGTGHLYEDFSYSSLGTARYNMLRGRSIDEDAPIGMPSIPEPVYTLPPMPIVR